MTAYSPGEIVGIYIIIERIGGKNRKYEVQCSICGCTSEVRVDRIKEHQKCKHCPRKFDPGSIVGIYTILKRLEKGRYLCCCNLCKTNSEVFIGGLLRSKQCAHCVVRTAIYIDGVLSKDHYLYAIWGSILDRTMNVNRKGYGNYGGRGVGVCDRWVYGEGGKSAFQCFAEDIHGRFGLRPNMYSAQIGDYKKGFSSRSYHLGRKDHDKDYDIENMNGWETTTESLVEMHIRHGHKVHSCTYDT